MNPATDPSPALDAALAAAEAAYAAANPLSRTQHERARGPLPGGHTRQTLYFPPFPLTIATGSGAHITDLDNHRYLNLVGDYAAGVFGATCLPLQSAVREALTEGIALSGPNRRELELAELITARIASIEQVRFCNSGSEACLFAVQVARHATQRQTVLVFDGCYHGGFLIFGPGKAPLTVPIPTVRATYNDVDGTRAVLRTHGSEIAAVIVEPMMGAAGAIPGAADFLGMLREETIRHGIVLIFDEVMTSRLAPGGLQEVHGIRPDLTTLGKFWGGGLAFGAFGGTRNLMRHLDVRSGGALSQGGTFNNNIVAMSAGLIGARDVYTPAACRDLNARGDALRERLNAAAAARGIACQVTGRGGVMNIHWQDTPIRHPGDLDPRQAPARRLFQLGMLEAGFYIAQRGLVTLSLPMTDADLGRLGEAFERYLEQHAGLLRLKTP